MTHNDALWFWSTFPVTGYSDPVNRPIIEAWQLATPCETPTENEYPYKPWDIHYDRRRDPAMIIMDAERARLDREYDKRVSWRKNKRGA